MIINRIIALNYCDVNPRPTPTIAVQQAVFSQASSAQRSDGKTIKLALVQTLQNQHSVQ